MNESKRIIYVGVGRDIHYISYTLLIPELRHYLGFEVVFITGNIRIAILITIRRRFNNEYIRFSLLKQVSLNKVNNVI